MPTYAKLQTVCGTKNAIWVWYVCPLTLAQFGSLAATELEMTNKRFVKIAFLVTVFMSIVAAGIALVRVRAQVSRVQPFVAIMVEDVAPRTDQPPISHIRYQTIAVRSDGSISTVDKWEARLPTRELYWREVIDATTKTHALVEDNTKTRMNREYSDLQILTPGVLCEGKPAGQMQGFDVWYSEHPVQGADNDTVVTHKQWQAPQLGCQSIVQQWVGKIHGLPVDTKQSLASIKLGEPDQWYFSVPPDYTTRTAEEWLNIAKPLLPQ